MFSSAVEVVDFLQNFWNLLKTSVNAWKNREVCHAFMVLDEEKNQKCLANETKSKKIRNQAILKILIKKR